MAGICPIGNRTTAKRAVGFTEMTVPGKLPPGVTIRPLPVSFSCEAQPAQTTIAQTLSQREIIGMVRTAHHRPACDMHETHVSCDVTIKLEPFGRHEFNDRQMLQCRLQI